MRALITLAVVGLLLVGGDALVRAFAEREAAESVEASLDLEGDVDVSLGGWPFVVHLLGGEFPSATVAVDRTAADGLRLADVEVEVKDVSFSPFSRSDQVTTKGGRGRAELTAAAVNDALTRLGSSARVEFHDGKATVTSDELGGSVAADVEVRGDDLVVTSHSGASIDVPLPSFTSNVTYESVDIDGDTAVLRFSISAGRFTAP